ncbi:MAG: AMP-binding protein [Acidimicrobiia bacterium]|nr:AMP-binding protein [Acidimicrobiia bacterium]
MYPGTYAEVTPDKPAVIMAGSGEQLTFAELEARSAQLAQLFWAAGLRPGDHVSIFMENNIRYFECFWAAIRSGLYFTTINRYLQPDETAYILEDSGARALITSAAMAELVVPVPAMARSCEVLLAVDGPVDGFGRYEDEVARYPAERLPSQPRGETMLYSSGTTGRPKGIKRPLLGVEVDDESGMGGVALLLGGLFGVTADAVYLSPAPLYHSAPLGFTTAVQSMGGTAVVMERFDPALALEYLDTYRITHSQWVPTMFSRMLKLPKEELEGHDWSSHEVAIHAAAPCPVEIKRQMFDLWGPIIYEYYAGTEVNGFVFCTPEDWLSHPGTVGKAILGTIHICDEEGNELPNGEAGIIFFEREEMPFEYHNDEEKTRNAQHPEHPNWSTLGDVGYVDDEGYLYLTDRKAFMIIAGGVNIYPQEIEDCLIVHPKVADVAVFGVPNDDLGEEVKAVVQPEEGIEANDALARELLDYAGEHIARYKVPRSIDFRDELPRLPTGKLYKRILKDEYWGDHATKIL